MVVTLLPATSLTGVEQDRVAAPFTCTVQAPHRPLPQPNFVPVRFRSSRSTQSNGVCGSTSSSRFSLFTVNAMGAISETLRCDCGGYQAGSLDHAPPGSKTDVRFTTA